MVKLIFWKWLDHLLLAIFYIFITFKIMASDKIIDLEVRNFEVKTFENLFFFRFWSQHFLEA